MSTPEMSLLERVEARRAADKDAGVRYRVSDIDIRRLADLMMLGPHRIPLRPGT